MTTAAIIEQIEQKVKAVEAHGFGEVVVKIKNGAVYRIISTTDTIVKDQQGTLGSGSICRKKEGDV